jgi:hypothetical protein
MPKRMPRRLLALTLTLLAAVPPPAPAKVSFTGYGNLLMTADSQFQVRGPAAVLGSTPEGSLVSKGFRTDAVGLFATTSVSDDAQFLVDLTFRNLGAAGAQTRVQYAYLDAGLPWWDLRAQVGRVNLPFNYYNSRRFYPFQRVELSVPLFINGILGLPIADSGAALSRRFELDGESGVDVRVYAVNGYGSIAGSTSSLRNPSLPGGLGMSGNLGVSNNNKDVAVGGQLAVNSAAGELGASYYRGAWDRDNRRMLQMAGAHALWTPGELDFLVEYLHLHATGDEGMGQSLGATSWQTHGAFLTVSHPLFRIGERAVKGWGHLENYHTARVGGGPGRETLRAYAGGAIYPVNDNLTLKAEGTYLFYAIPTNAQSIILDGRLLQAAVVITF